jgi:hypothetical protein
MVLTTILVFEYETLSSIPMLVSFGFQLVPILGLIIEYSDCWFKILIFFLSKLEFELKGTTQKLELTIGLWLELDPKLKLAPKPSLFKF